MSHRIIPSCNDAPAPLPPSRPGLIPPPVRPAALSAPEVDHVPHTVFRDFHPFCPFGLFHPARPLPDAPSRAFRGPFRGPVLVMLACFRRRALP